MAIIKFNPDSYRGKKYATHVIGLDNLLRDGIVLPPKHHENSANGTVILIKGKPGTGKTTLGLQLLIGLTKSFVLNNNLSFEKDANNKGTIDKSVFFSIEQEKEELEDKLMDIEISRIFEDYKNKLFAKSEDSEETKILKKRCKLINNFFGISPKDEKDTDNLNQFFKILTYNSFENSIVFSISKNDSYLDFILEKIKRSDIPNRQEEIRKFFIANFFKYKTLFASIISTIHTLDASRHYIKDFIKQKAEKFHELKSLYPLIQAIDYNADDDSIKNKLKSGNKGIEDAMLDEIMLYVRTLQLGNLIEKLGVLKHNILEDKKFILIINENSKKCSPEFLTSLINILLLIYSVRIDRKKINKKKTEILEELKEAFDKWREKDKAINQTKSVKTLTSDIIKQLNEFSNDHNEITYDKVFSLIQSTFNNKCNTEKIEGAVQKLFSEHTHDQAIPLLNLYIKSNDNVTKTPDAAYNFSPVQKVLDFINEIEENEKAQKNKIEKETQNKYYPCVVLDGLNILTDQEKKVLNLNQIIKTLKKKVFFSILVYDGNTDRDLYQDYLADMVIELRGEEKIQPVHYFLHDLQISKSRFQSAAYGWHQYKIREFGLQVYKSVHFHLHINKYMDNQLTDSFQAITYSPKIEIAKTKGKNKTNTERIFNTSIEKILNAPIPGSFTVILGPRATFKTALTLKFLYNSAVVKDEENKDTKDGDSLLVSVVDNLGTLHNACKCPRSKLDKEEIRVKRNCKLCHEHFYIFHLRPGCITPDEFFHYLECRIKEHKSICRKDITRLAFWDLTQLEYRFPLFLSDSMFLPGLIGFGKKNKIAMIVMGAGNSALTPAASAVADNVIFTWRDENKKEKNKGVLAVYVDRCEGKLGQEGKELTYLNIEENKQVLQLDCPKIENTDKKFYTCNETDLGNAKKMIRDITDMQGMGGVKNGSEESTEKQSIEKTAKVAS